MQIMEIQLDAMLEKLFKVNVPLEHTMIVAEINLVVFTAVKPDKHRIQGVPINTCVAVVPVSTGITV